MHDRLHRSVASRDSNSVREVSCVGLHAVNVVVDYLL